MRTFKFLLVLLFSISLVINSVYADSLQAKETQQLNHFTSSINTVTGPVAAQSLGLSLTHEHIMSILYINIYNVID